MDENYKRGTIFPGSSRKRLHYTDPLSEKVLSDPTKKYNNKINLSSSPSSSSRSINTADPWETYNRGYNLQLGGSIVIASRIPITNDLYIIQTFSTQDIDKKLEKLQVFRHRNLLKLYEIFYNEKQSIYHLIYEDAAVSCEDLIRVKPNELQLAAIIYQVS
jgi:hypothetical protein